MRVTILLIAVAAAAAAATVSVSMSDMTDTTLPSTAPPAGTTSGPSYCTALDLSQYSNLPKPTGSLLDEFYSFQSELQKECTATESGIGSESQSCSATESSQWCSFSTAVPSTLHSDYSSYASSASEWWSQHHSAATDECADSNLPSPPSSSIGWLNVTSIYAGCYAEGKRQVDADRTTMTTTTMATGTPGATTGQTITVPSRSGSATTTGGPKATAKPNGALGRAGMTGIWIVVGMGMAAAVVNTA
ncbi:hypothetical protein H109_00266 [Trichophyton interdigitale MR816]|uniref:DUF7735 domain-containing protein n=1 Tax=Trichophyton interdigitale (strain MR816) TaxID=1215338 RepID=A0A059JJ98_TRIIM|nr:hypothetical protein H101_05074 [Trichophyton interdigitale H6]KDB27971.1 hypothetical protein H109_00266 [Trichophyton interdigitale MR816]